MEALSLALLVCILSIGLAQFLLAGCSARQEQDKAGGTKTKKAACQAQPGKANQDFKLSNFPSYQESIFLLLITKTKKAACQAQPGISNQDVKFQDIRDLREDYANYQLSLGISFVQTKILKLKIRIWLEKDHSVVQ